MYSLMANNGYKRNDGIFIPKENTPYCKNNPGYVAYVDWPNKKGTDFVICTSRITRGNSYDYSYDLINDAVRHEAIHSAQFCRYTSYNDYLLYPLGTVDKKVLLNYVNQGEITLKN